MEIVDGPSYYYFMHDQCHIDFLEYLDRYWFLPGSVVLLIWEEYIFDFTGGVSLNMLLICWISLDDVYESI